MTEEGLNKAIEILGLSEFEVIAIREIMSGLETKPFGPERDEGYIELGALIGPKIETWIES